MNAKVFVTMIGGCFLLSPSNATADESQLATPVPVLSEGKPIDVEHSGHAAPFVGDFDGDGRKDLLVGEYYKGRLRIYRNVGTNDAPKFDGFRLFRDGAPGGCIYAS